MQSWSIIIICFNEEKTVRKVADSVIQLFAPYRDRKLEIIIVDDGSKDNSVKEIKKAGAEHKGVIKLVAHETNLGIGAALKTGYKSAINENVCTIPADGQFDISELKPYLDFESNQFISFYRKENLQYSFSRNILSLINKKINHLFLGIDLNDVNWVKTYKTKAIQSLDWKIKSSLIESELCAKLIYLEFQPIQVKSVYLPRHYGKSRGASLKILLQALKETFKLILIVHHFKKTIKKNKNGF